MPKNTLHSSDLKSILHSKRANIFYLEHCRILQKDGRVLYLTETNKEKLYYNIPIANTTVILLGTGTSITQAAMRLLAAAAVLVGFTGGGGTPLLMATEQEIAISWLTPQSEYRPTKYIQGWLSWWWDENKRLQMAKHLQLARLDFLQRVWGQDKELKSYGFDSSLDKMISLQNQHRKEIIRQNSTTDLLTLEGRLTKDLYKMAARQTHQVGFVRNHDGMDKANGFLNHGNYLAYGLGAATAWVLGIPHGFAVMHGKTRRGALIFDIADIVKDAIVLPLAFICASENLSEQEFRQECLNYFTDHHALDTMFEVVEGMALNQDWI